MLTQAAHPRLAVAVDVMIKCPNATGAGRDCTEQGKREKLARYDSVLRKLAERALQDMVHDGATVVSGAWFFALIVQA